MSYQTKLGGPRSYHGAGYYGLSGDYPIYTVNSSTSDLQRELVRLGFLRSTPDEFGVDGKMGPNTLNAVRFAAQYVRWVGAPYTPTNAAQLRRGTVNIPDDLIERIRAASPAPTGTVGLQREAAISPDAPVLPERPGSTFIGPHLDPVEQPSAEGAGVPGWLPTAMLGGAIVIVGGIAIYAAARKENTRTRVTANRRRRRRR